MISTDEMNRPPRRILGRIANLPQQLRRLKLPPGSLEDVTTQRWLVVLDVALMAAAFTAHFATESWLAIGLSVASAMLFGWLLVNYDFCEGCYDRIPRDPDHISTLSTFLRPLDDYSAPK